MRRAVLLAAVIVLSGGVLADGACWIAYPGDHAIEQGNRLMARRNNHGRPEPSPWAAHAAWPTVVFEADADFPEEETVEIVAQGTYYARRDGRATRTTPGSSRRASTRSRSVSAIRAACRRSSSTADT